MWAIDRTANPRRQGDAGLGVAIGWFATHGYTVCLPLTDSQRFDLVTVNGCMRRVQVKTSTKPGRSGWEVDLRTRGTSGTGTITKYISLEEADDLFVVTADGAAYLIPIENVSGQSTICLPGRFKEFSV